jgi:2-oxoglutarate ferredoxin oxidoreductase subunit beta
MRKKEDYHLENPTWCRGCGLFGIFDALKRAAATLDLSPEQMVVVTGIGCHGRLNNYFNAYGFHGLHGRALPVAEGVKLANPQLHVLAVSGDGDAYAIGLSHFIHAARRNTNITYLVVNNRIFALTQGQASPTSSRGFVSISSPAGAKEYPLDGPQLALAAGATFIARGFSGEAAALAGLIEQGIQHKGFSLVDILSPCVTHNKINTYEWYRNNIDHPDKAPGYNVRDRMKAWQTLDQKEKIAVGLIYREEKESFEEAVLRDPKEPIALSRLTPDLPALEKIMEKFS